MARNMEIKQREFDQKFVVWAEIDQMDADRDWYIKNGLPVPQQWVPVAVTFTKDAAIRAMKQAKI
jgi:hypothetical protein